MAQDQKWEFSAKFGYTLSNGVDVDKVAVEGTNQEVVRMAPKSGPSWGVQLDYLAYEHVSFGFLWDMQYSKLILKTQDMSSPPEDAVAVSAGDHEISNMKLYNYYGVATYNFGSRNSKIRPFFFGGLGAVHYDPGELLIAPTTSSGSSEPGSVTRFSSTWGGGIKAYFSPNVGVRAGVRWTPAHISDVPVGFFCTSEWGCQVSASNQYSHQLVWNGGLMIRF